MDSVEERTKRIIKRGKVQDSIMATLYGAATLSLMVAAPNTVQLLKYIDPYIGKKNASKRMSQAIGRLVSKKYLARTGRGAQAKLTLSTKGKQYVQLLLDSYTVALARPKKWDGRWRVVMFDIWESRRSVRDRLRFLLRRIGFVKIQNSVWVYPHDCEEVVALVRAELRTGKSVSYLIADALEGDRELRKIFGLRV
jgi:DNA-binding transcriptional regulator PaaX